MFGAGGRCVDDVGNRTGRSEEGVGCTWNEEEECGCGTEMGYES